MILADYHLHSLFSSDSKEELENIVKIALERGMTEIAITDHLDIDYPNGQFNLEIDNYIETLKKIRFKYQGKIKIKIGVELGLQKHLSGNRKLKSIMENENIDFIIGSTHTIDGYELDKEKIYSELSKEEVHIKYFEEVYQNISSIDGFNVCGHLDFIRRYGRKSYSDYEVIDYNLHKKIIEKILKLLISRGQGIEVNSSGIRYVGDQHPNDYILKKYKELGGKIITVGSDSHVAKDIAKDFEKIREVLIECGFKYYSTFDKKQVEYIKL